VSAHPSHGLMRRGDKLLGSERLDGRDKDSIQAYRLQGEDGEDYGPEYYQERDSLD